MKDTALDQHDRPLMIHSGMQLQSNSGRSMKPAPKIDCTSNRRCVNSVARLRTWLLGEAVEEARSRQDRFAETQLNCIDAKEMTLSDIDLVNLFLFGDVTGPRRCHLPK